MVPHYKTAPCRSCVPRLPNDRLLAAVVVPNPTASAPLSCLSRKSVTYLYLRGSSDISFVNLDSDQARAVLVRTFPSEAVASANLAMSSHWKGRTMGYEIINAFPSMPTPIPSASPENIGIPTSPATRSHRWAAFYTSTPCRVSAEEIRCSRASMQPTMRCLRA